VLVELFLEWPIQVDPSQLQTMVNVPQTEVFNLQHTIKKSLSYVSVIPITVIYMVQR